ncbi:MAG: type II secretion system protein [Candidatus Omnitrophica bacterium]|nr:type II secretion system protein [Candidatus Omnitrophota bacterium]
MKLIPRSPRRKLKGFTLIELIMAIVVVGIIALPISITLSRHVQSVFQSQDMTMANNLARFDLEQVNNTGYDDISSANISGYQGYDYDLTRTVSLINSWFFGLESTKKITVQVSKSGSAAVLVKLVTYISRNVRYPF